MHLEPLLFAAFVLLVVCAASVALFKWLGLGSILGLLAAGVIVGPSVLGLAKRVIELREISEIGIAFLLFLIGLEMKPQRLWALRRQVFGLGSAQVLATGAALALYTMWIGWHWELALILGFGAALSSTAFVMQLLDERGARQTPHGQTAFAILLFQDLCIVPLLALVPILAGGTREAPADPLLWRIGHVLLALAVVYVAGRYVVRGALAWLHEHNPEAFAVTSVAAVIGAIWVMLAAHLSMALGAFMLGVLLSDSPHRNRIEEVIAPFKGALVGLFFVGVGMSIDLSYLPNAGVLLATHLLVIVAIKALVLVVLCLAFGLDRVSSVRVALLLAQCGEFGFVLFGAAAAAALMSPEGFVMSALVISMSMIVTPLLAKVADRIGEPSPALE